MLRRHLPAIVLVALATVTLACSPTASGADVQLTSMPNPPKMGRNTFTVTVKQPNGTPITDANVSVEFHMPAMPAMNMAEMRSTATLGHQGDGQYRGEAELMSPGNWDTTVTVTRGAETLARNTLTLTAQ